jgi:hypothetical protein
MLGFVLETSGHARGETSPNCSERKAESAQRETAQLDDWDAIYRAFKRFAACDDGLVAEQYSDSINHLLAYDWKDLGPFLRLTAADPNFEDFVIRHVNETMTEDEAIRIVKNARSRCPAAAKRLCKSIGG